jgi:hypothetical protein
MMNKREALEIHIKLWGLLSENPNYEKRDAILELGLPEDMKADCACCEYCLQNGLTKEDPDTGRIFSDCSKCLIQDWTETDDLTPCCAEDSPFEHWDQTFHDDPEYRSVCAKKVADLGRDALKGVQ